MIALLLFAAEEAEEASTLIKQESAAVILLAIAAGVSVLARLFRFPFTVALVIAGFAAALLGDVVDVEVNSELILALLVPPLLFEATLHLPWAKLKADLFDVLNIALVGTAMGTFLVGWTVHTFLDIPWALAFAFGALISATDPVAVVAFFKTLGVPKRLTILVEGESLFNDAIAVVAFTLAIAVAEGEEFSFSEAVADFIIVSAGGLAVGLILGWIVSNVILASLDDPLIETTTTLALAYGSFLIAEDFGAIIGQDFHFSGILAVVAAGLMVGNVGFKNTSPSTRLTLDNFWELLTFLVNSMVFLFIGLTIGLTDLIDNIDAVALAVVTVLLVRILVVYGLAGISNVVKPARRIPTKFQHVMYWGGLRGAISLALALTIQDNDVLQEDIAGVVDVRTVVVMAFGVVLFTLLIQGLTIETLITHLGLAGRATNELEQQAFQARVHMQRAGQNAVNRLGSEGVVFDDMADSLATVYQRDINRRTDDLSDHVRQHPELESAMLIRARRDALTAEQSALTEVLRTGLVDTEVAEELSIELDNRLAALDVLKLRWETDETPHGEERGDV